MAKILVVDDEVGIRELLSEILTDEGYTVVAAENATAAKAARDQARPDLVLLDIWMPDMDGISLLKAWHANGQLNMPVVMMSGHATIDTAVEATRIGAVDFLEKPIALQKLLNTVKHAIRQTGLTTRSSLSFATLTRATAMREFCKRLEQVVRGSRTVYLKGIYGGLAELAGRSLQNAQTPWLDMAELSAPITAELLQKYQGGLVFCGNLSALGRMQQMNLAFVLERLDKLNLTLVLGSEKNLQTFDGVWDANLLRRLGEVWMSLPELSRCQEDIPDIAGLMLLHLVECKEVAACELSVGALNQLRQLQWQAGADGWLMLWSAVRNLALNCLEEEIQAQDVLSLLSLPDDQKADTRAGQGALLTGWLDLPLREARDAFEKHYFEHMLDKENGNMTRVAENSGLERTHLYRKLKQLGVATGRRGDD